MERNRTSSFASTEATELDFDFSFATNRGRDASADQLLSGSNETVDAENDYQRTRNDIPSRTNVYNEVRDATQSGQIPMDELSNLRSRKQVYCDISQISEDATVQWKGYPVYYLTWEALGILISICFFSKDFFYW